MRKPRPGRFAAGVGVFSFLLTHRILSSAHLPFVAALQLQKQLLKQWNHVENTSRASFYKSSTNQAPAVPGLGSGSSLPPSPVAFSSGSSPGKPDDKNPPKIPVLQFTLLLDGLNYHDFLKPSHENAREELAILLKRGTLEALEGIIPHAEKRLGSAPGSGSAPAGSGAVPAGTSAGSTSEGQNPTVGPLLLQMNKRFRKTSSSSDRKVQLRKRKASLQKSNKQDPEEEEEEEEEEEPEEPTDAAASASDDAEPPAPATASAPAVQPPAPAVMSTSSPTGSTQFSFSAAFETQNEELLQKEKENKKKLFVQWTEGPHTPEAVPHFDTYAGSGPGSAFSHPGGSSPSQGHYPYDSSITGVTLKAFGSELPPEIITAVHQEFDSNPAFYLETFTGHLQHVLGMATLTDWGNGAEGMYGSGSAAMLNETASTAGGAAAAAPAGAPVVFLNQGADEKGSGNTKTTTTSSSHLQQQKVLDSKQQHAATEESKKQVPAPAAPVVSGGSGSTSFPLSPFPDVEIEPDFELEMDVAFLPLCKQKLTHTLHDLHLHATQVETKRRFQAGCEEGLKGPLALQKCLEFSDFVVHHVLPEEDAGKKATAITHGCTLLCLRKFGPDPRCQEPIAAGSSGSGSSGATAATTGSGPYDLATSTPEEVANWIENEEKEDSQIISSLPTTPREHEFVRTPEPHVNDGTILDDDMQKMMHAEQPGSGGAAGAVTTPSAGTA
ncbi:unnamed protein product [Amoebophrya sp. A120]|nr:unnamed protein product [Amoebophrya sp. A120]|eukprot:GSA120T00021149001.1